MDNYVLNFYIQVRVIPTCTMLAVFPELGNTDNELQYQLLKLEYRLLETTDDIVIAFENVCSLMRMCVDAVISDSFKQISDSIFDYDDELCYRQEDTPSRHWYNRNNIYQYTKDIRKETRRYLRNRVC